MTVLPYKDQSLGKKDQVSKMFDNISGKYDFLNHFLSLGIDIQWRKKAIRMLTQTKPQGWLLDVATGTGDFAIQALKANPEKVIGVDISKGMLEVGRQKIERLGLTNKIELHYGDSENLQFEDNTFGAVIVSFGVRNFENLEKGLAEIHRVLKPGGYIQVLEFSQPTGFPFKQIYHTYFKYLLPLIGNFVSKDQAAYTYLPESVQAFPSGKAFVEILSKLGFKEPKDTPLTFGVCSIYMARKS